MGASLAAPLQAVAAAGLRVVDVQSREARLEDVLVELLHAAPAEAAPTRAGANINERSFINPPAPPPSEPLLGARTLFKKEVMRFLRVPGQTLLSPLVTTALYFLVFGFSLGGKLREVEGVPYLAFLVPGLVMLGIISNSFLNTSSSLFIMKMQGTIVDLLVTPLSYLEVLGAFVAAACVRALAVGALTWATAAIFAGPRVAHPLLALLACALVAGAFAAFGLCVAIWADKFEQVNFVPTFVITPLTFLGGVFYSAAMLPESLQHALHANPIFYMIELVRFALLGRSGAAPWLSGALITGFALLVAAAALQMLRRGYKLRS
jgi:ABC-2 type transport system permease protein